MYPVESQITVRKALMALVTLIAACSLAFGDGASAGSGQSSDFKNDPKARDLVRQIVANELKQEEQDKSHYMFKLKKVTPKGTRVQQIVQTDQGSIARTLLVDGQPPTTEQKRAEEEKIQKLVQDPAEQSRRLKREKEDEGRAHIMVKALPNAFLYQEIGREGETLKLRFQPDPGYQPQSREESVYTGMAGELWLNVAKQRLQKIDAHLFHDVDFGWGILGRLYKGGGFVVQQEQVDATHWDATTLKLDLTGKALLFKSLVYNEQEYESDFHRLPDHLAIAQGAEILKRGVPEVAQKNGQ